jgi:hypothetical protein
MASWYSQNEEGLNDKSLTESYCQAYTEGSGYNTGSFSMVASQERLLNLINSIINEFNARDMNVRHVSDDMVSNFHEAVELCGAPDRDVKMCIECLGHMRVIACEFAMTDTMIRVDEVLQSMTGTGIPQVSQERDAEFRTAVNEIITVSNNGDVVETIKHMQAWISMCRTEPEISSGQADCFPPLLMIAQEIGQVDVVSELKSLEAQVLAQQQVQTTCHEMMPTINQLAIDYPDVVTIETFMKCNAKCSFCPYPDMAETSPRADLRMPEELFAKIIDDLTDIPTSFGFQINLSRVNEPLLDHRLFTFMDMIEEKLPQVLMFMPTNGSTLTDKNIEKLATYGSFKKLMVSLNCHEKDAYEQEMKIPFERTIANLDRLHVLKQAGKIGFMTILTAVMDEGADWDEFKIWCEERYPGFVVDRYPPTNWFGMTENEARPVITQPSGCKDWYQVHILADGSEAQCCYDAEGKYGDGNVANMHVLDIYNKEWQRKLRRMGAIRQSDLAPRFCQLCTYS